MKLPTYGQLVNVAHCAHGNAMPKTSGLRNFSASNGTTVMLRNGSRTTRGYRNVIGAARREVHHEDILGGSMLHTL